jgi:hypothetical protein
MPNYFVPASTLTVSCDSRLIPPLKRINSSKYCGRCIGSVKQKIARSAFPGGLSYNKLRVDSRTASSGAILRWTAENSRFSSNALIPSTTMLTAVLPIASIG